jgi:hypothetical protein
MPSKGNTLVSEEVPDDAVSGRTMSNRSHTRDLILILLLWSIGHAPNNANKWQMGYNLAFKGLGHLSIHSTVAAVRCPLCFDARGPVAYLKMVGPSS